MFIGHIKKVAGLLETVEIVQASDWALRHLPANR